MAFTRDELLDRLRRLSIGHDGRPGPADGHVEWHRREVFKEVTGQTGAA